MYCDRAARGRRPLSSRPRATLLTCTTHAPRADADGDGANQARAADHAWEEYVSEDGRPYYHNTVLEETVWEKPHGFDAQVAGLPPGWVAHESPDHDGAMYYHNEETGPLAAGLPYPEAATAVEANAKVGKECAVAGLGHCLPQLGQIRVVLDVANIGHYRESGSREARRTQWSWQQVERAFEYYGA